MPGGAGPIGLPIFLLVGYYLFENTVLRIFCVVGLVGWLIYIIVMITINQAWLFLIYPLLVVFAWFIISDVNKFGESAVQLCSDCAVIV